MNRKLLALAIGAVMSLPLAAQAAPTVYGQLNLSVDRVDFEGAGPGGADWEETQLNSNASRLGVKGEEVLGDGLSAVYKAEWAVSGDTAGANDLTGRDRYLGLKSNSLGTIKLGAYDSPLKTSQGKVDQFNDLTYTDLANFISGDNRLSNVIGYESPKIADALTVNLAVQSGEDSDGDPATAPGDDDGQSLSVVYEGGGLYLAAAMDNDIEDGLIFDLVNSLPLPAVSSEALSRDAIRLTGVYSDDTVQVGAMLQSSEFSNDEAGFDLDEQSILLSASLAMGKNTLKGQFIMANADLGGGAEIDTTAIELGVDHNFTAMTKVFGQLALINVDAGTGADSDNTVIGVGMQTKF